MKRAFWLLLQTDICFITHIHLKFLNLFALTSFICNEISINLSTSGNLFPYSNLRECTHLLFKKNSQHSIKIEVDNEFCGFRNIFCDIWTFFCLPPSPMEVVILASGQASFKRIRKSRVYSHPSLRKRNTFQDLIK